MWRRSSHIVTMPIFLCNVNCVYDEKPVPITRQIRTSNEPAAEEIVLKRVEGVPRMGPSRNEKLVYLICDC
jgi:hypothetical protein